MFRNGLIFITFLFLTNCSPSKPSNKTQAKSEASVVVTSDQVSKINVGAQRGIASIQESSLNQYFFMLPEERRNVFPQGNQRIISRGLGEALEDATDGDCRSTQRVVRNLCLGLLQGLKNRDCGLFENRVFYSACMGFSGLPGSTPEERLNKLKQAFRQAQQNSADGVCDQSPGVDIELCNQIVGASVNICLGKCNNLCHAFRSLNSQSTTGAESSESQDSTEP